MFLCYHDGIGTKQDYTKALELLPDAAVLENEEIQFKAGICYAEGLGTARDYEKAFKLFSLTAEQGNKAALYNLGVYYTNGYGTEKDEKKPLNILLRRMKPVVSRKRGKNWGFVILTAQELIKIS